ncbi:MAG TPA: glycosyltransferase family 2 protein [Candidatus Andersenbacteria bacterium]|nr:MAG: hypothetical protein A3E38_02950 [Candidatus Moranbacteria bacterium RIFCSPHIGHO2_12_FULL_54_9]OHB20019.1 MAG: hypothetical protein A2854_01815 [Parcubacteria group bacterium RIFCSPHIGHO2_01_FULL_56_18]HLD25896.1 glycosyltransferase family 2 protein [Candidatus Andersenbacteria bacterium]
MTQIGISIVNWNTGELLARCLRSLAALPDAERAGIAEVVVVDNASRDRSVAQATVAAAENADQLRIRLVNLKENAGFARANNIAIERLTRRSPDCHVLLLNPDTEVRTGALPVLLGVLERHERAGIVGPKLLNPDGTLQPSVRAFPSLGVFVCLFLKLHRLSPRLKLWQRYMQADFDYTREQPVDQVMGAAFLIRREVLKVLGGLDEAFWVWFEEVDFCKRARVAGWEAWYTPAGEIVHHGGVSFSQLSSWRRAIPWVRSSLHYASKHFTMIEQVVLLVLAPVALLLSLPAAWFHSRK